VIIGDVCQLLNYLSHHITLALCSLTHFHENRIRQLYICNCNNLSCDSHTICYTASPINLIPTLMSMQVTQQSLQSVLHMI
jgi:hypothetical protein